MLGLGKQRGRARAGMHAGQSERTGRRDSLRFRWTVRLPTTRVCCGFGACRSHAGLALTPPHSYQGMHVGMPRAAAQCLPKFADFPPRRRSPSPPPPAPGVLADLVHAVVFVVGLSMLLWQRLQVGRGECGQLGAVGGGVVAALGETRAAGARWQGCGSFYATSGPLAWSQGLLHKCRVAREVAPWHWHVGAASPRVKCALAWRPSARSSWQHSLPS